MLQNRDALLFVFWGIVKIYLSVRTRRESVDNTYLDAMNKLQKAQLPDTDKGLLCRVKL